MAFLAAAAPVLGVLGGVVGAAGSLYQGMYAGQVSKNNAIVAKQNADYVEKAGQVEAEVQSMKGAAKSARIKSVQSASGVDVNTGSAAAVQASQRGANAFDIETIVHNADLSAYGYRTQAKNFEDQATQDEVGGFLNAGSTLIGSASSINWGTGGSKVPLGTTGELSGNGSST